MFYYEDNKGMNLRLFKLKFVHTFNDVDDNLFKEIFGHTSVKLADKLIKIASKEENQTFINDIEINRDKMFEQDKYGKFVIRPTHKRGDLLDVVRVKFMPEMHLRQPGVAYSASKNKQKITIYKK